jgi:hypothetical protein
MKHTRYLFLILLALSMLSGCTNFGNSDNPMFGKSYRNASDLPEFTGYLEIHSSVIESSKDKNGNYKLGLTELAKVGQQIVILEEISDPDEKGKVTYKILDTICVTKLKEGQFLTYGSCYKNDVFEETLIALAALNGESEYYKIIKVWSADTETGRIKTLTGTKGITCMADLGCGYDDYEEGEEDTDSTAADTTSQTKGIDTVLNQTPVEYPVDSLNQ